MCLVKQQGKLLLSLDKRIKFNSIQICFTEIVTEDGNSVIDALNVCEIHTVITEKIITKSVINTTLRI